MRRRHKAKGLCRCLCALYTFDFTNQIKGGSIVHPMVYRSIQEARTVQILLKLHQALREIFIRITIFLFQLNLLCLPYVFTYYEACGVHINATTKTVLITNLLSYCHSPWKSWLRSAPASSIITPSGVLARQTEWYHPFLLLKVEKNII